MLIEGIDGDIDSSNDLTNSFVGTSSSDHTSDSGNNDTVTSKAGDDSTVGLTGNDNLTGGGNRARFAIVVGEGTDTIIDFGGVGRGVNPPQSVIDEVDTLQFFGTELTAENLRLSQKQANLELTFEGVEDTKIVLKDFKLEDLDNLTQETGAAVTIGNILFDGQQEIQDGFDVFNAKQSRRKIFNPNTVTFLNDLDNTIQGLENSDDTINAQGGDDIIQGRSGNDILRGLEGNDSLQGNEGNDTLDGGLGNDIAIFEGESSEYQITTSETGTTTVEHTGDRGEGTDRLLGIETIVFADREISLGEDSGNPDVPEEIIGTVGSIEISISSPSSIIADGTDEVTVTYRNTGDTDAVAPLLNLAATGALLRPNDRQEFTESQIQFLAINYEGQAGVLAPRASGSFTVEFVPDDANDNAINFTVSGINPDETINWDEFREDLKPDYLTDEAWNAIYDNFIGSIGSTAGDYQEVLVNNANYLSELGEYVADANRLVGFEFQQASNYQALAQRYSLGSFGRGRSFIGDLEAVADENSNVSIEYAGTQRLFILQEDGSYLSAVDEDYGTLTSEGEAYRLEEQSGVVTVFRPNGSLNFIEDPNGNRITAEYTNDRITGLVGSNEDRLTFTYNDSGRIASVADRSGRITTYEYDETGELLLRVASPEGSSTFTYDDNFAITSVAEGDGTQANLKYDDFGRLIEESLNEGAETITYNYNNAGNVTVTDASGANVEFFLDDRGQVNRLQAPLGQELNLEYDQLGNLIQVTAPDNNALNFTYDDRGNLLSQVDSLGQRTEFTYEPNFQLLESITDPRGNAIDYDYDDEGNLISINYADGSSETYSYDEAGNFTQSVNRRDQTIAFNYNQLGQLLRQDNADGSFSAYTYDEQGNLTSATDDNGTISLEYDTGDRLTKIIYPDGRSLTYTYDAGNSRTSMVDQDGNTVNYSYDLAGRLAGLTDSNGNSIIDYIYDDVGRLIREDNGNGTYTTYAYDDAGQLSSLINYAPDDSINSRYDYSYDELGQQIGASTLDGEWTYSYDTIGQLANAAFSSTNPEVPDQNLEYVYDAAGNRIRTIVNGDTTEYSANNLNQYETAGDIVYDYDTDGNLISKTEGDDVTTYEYNNENRLVKVIEPNGIETEYEYDPIGNRIATIYNGERTEYLVDPFGFGDIVGEYDSDGNLIANYTHGNGLVSRSNDNDSAFYDADAIGSTVGLTNAAGDQVNSYSYLPFGQELSETEAIENSFEFVGQWGVTEETNGLDFMRARLYDPLIGRFISPDPIGIAGGDTNLYRYVFNNPNNYADPSGTVVFVPILVAAGTGAFIGAVTDIAIQVGANLIGNVVNGGGYGDTFDIDWGSVLVSAGLGAVGGGVTAAFKNTTLISSQIGTQFSHGIPKVWGNPVTRGGNPNPRKKQWVPEWLVNPEHFLGRLNGQFVGTRFHFKTDPVSFAGYGNTRYGGGKVPAGTHAGISKYPSSIQKILRVPAWIYGIGGGTILGNIFGGEIANAATDIFDTDSQTPSAPGESPVFPIVAADLIPLAALNVARSKGEPHLTTFDGVGYDFQGSGDFTLVESLDGDLNIQVRYVQIDSNVTVASAVATEVDGQNVVIDSQGIEFVDAEGNPVEEGGIPQVTRSVIGGEAALTIDGETVAIPSGGSIKVGNSQIYRSGSGKYTIVYAGEDEIVNDGDDQLVVNYFRPGTINIVDVYLGDEKQGQITGLLGNLDGDPDNDVALRDGTVLPRPLEFDRLYGDYRDDYLVSDIEESLFTYELGQNPDTYYNPSFPKAPFTYDDLTPELRTLGDAAALKAGYEPGTFAFESAAFDFAVTRDPGFLEGSATDPAANGVAIVDDEDGDGSDGTGTSSIQGIKFNDLNGNGVRDTELVQGEDPDVVFAIDVSFSANDPFQGTSVGDINGDNISNSVLDAEIAGFIGLNQQLIAQGLGDNVDVGIIAFRGIASQIDLDLQSDGVQITTTPNADTNDNGILDVEEALSSLRTGSGTNFESALQAAEEFFSSLGTEPGNGNLVFLSDGENLLGGTIDDEVERLNNLGVNLSAFGAGESASLGDLQIIDPDAEIFTSTDEILDAFAGLNTTTGEDDSPSLLEPGLEGVNIYLDFNDNGLLDDGEPSQVTDENGQYLFSELSAGTYTVREVIPDGFSQTVPTSEQFIIELGAGETIEEINFGNTEIEPLNSSGVAGILVYTGFE